MHNWNVIGPLAGLAGLLLVLLLAAALFYFRKHRRFTNSTPRFTFSTSTLERDQSLSDVVVELPAALVQRTNDAPGPSEMTDPVEVERDAGRQLLRDKIAESGGGGLGLAANGRMSPLPADEPHFDVVEAISEAGSADAALLAAVCRYASAAEVRELLEHGASPNTSFLHHSALALAVRCCSSQASKALLDARANVDSKDPQGWTALMHAIDAHSATFSRETILVQLLDAGAAVDVWGHDLRGPFELMEEKVGVGEKSHSRATGERRLTELMHQHSGPATVQLVPDDRSDDEGEAAAALPGFRSSLLQKFGGGPAVDRCAPAPLPAPFLSPRQVATAPLVERMGSKQAAVVPNPLRYSNTVR